ncbi:MAG: hypothetical protein KJO64_02680 [Bacteroidia bacterium]|nr:hypothetical protein [Bacteroidia bacterium]NNC86383.1 hypothetical protein [Bacteroidia bacterium]
MIYLTYSDPLTGVFQSQVIDVCNYLNKALDIKVCLVSFISIKGFWKSRKRIKALTKNALVLPMFPTIILWKLNAITLFFTVLLTGERVIIARGVFACNMALILKPLLIRKVSYDGRAAVSAEYTEYDVSPYKSLLPVIKLAEKKAVIKSDFRLSVSTELIKYWENQFNYNSRQHVIIPSTVNSSWSQDLLHSQEKMEMRKLLGLPEEKVIIVYSGSTAGWQSLDLMSDFVSKILEKQPNILFLVLSPSSPQITDFNKRFSNNFVEKWVLHNEVEKYLKVCDYGILLRDETTTNKVASPVKFAEYLSAGLSVIISKNIGDASSFVNENNCGFVVNEKLENDLKPLSEEQRIKNSNLAKKFFTKEAYFSQYKICTDSLMNKE